MKQICHNFYSVLESYTVAFVSQSKNDATLQSQAACHSKASVDFPHDVQDQHGFYYFQLWDLQFFKIALLASLFIKSIKSDTHCEGRMQWQCG